MAKAERERWILALLAGCLVGMFSSGIRGNMGLAAGMGTAAFSLAVVYLIVFFNS